MGKNSLDEATFTRFEATFLVNMIPLFSLSLQPPEFHKTSNQTAATLLFQSCALSSQFFYLPLVPCCPLVQEDQEYLALPMKRKERTT